MATQLVIHLRPEWSVFEINPGALHYGFLHKDNLRGRFEVVAEGLTMAEAEIVAKDLSNQGWTVRSAMTR